MLTGKLDFRRYYQQVLEGKWKIGARIGNTPILEYEVWSNKVPVGHSTSSKMAIDLSLEDFLKIAGPNSH
ncbi:MAG: hypothetical protein ABIR06_03095 [Cyclobacteriaceae bacterium]